MARSAKRHVLKLTMPPRATVADGRAVGEDELHFLLEIGAGDRRRRGGERMIRRHHRHHRDRDQEFGLAVVGQTGERDAEGEPRRAVAKPLLGAAHRFGEHRDLKTGIDLAQRLEARRQHCAREHRVDRQRQLGLDALADALRLRLDRFRAADQSPRIGEEHTARVIELRHLAVAIEDGDGERGLQRLHRLADRRLDAPETARGSRKAAFLGNCHKDAQLVERERIQHDL